MRRERLFFLTAVFIAGGFLFFGASFAESSILFSQISTDNSSATDEFVELYNYSDSVVLLEGFKIKKIASTGSESYLVSDFGSALINPFGYLLIAHPDYSNIKEVSADVIYTNKSNSLAQNNNGVVLFGSDGQLIDLVVWGEVSSTYCCGNTLEKVEKNKSISRLPDNEEGNFQSTGDCSADFIVLDDFLPRNSQSMPRPFWEPIDPPTSTPTTTPPTDPPTSTPTTTPPFDDDDDDETPTTTPPGLPIDWLTIKINEFVVNPVSGNEWVELYNISSIDVDLNGAKICDNRETVCKDLSGTILANDWFYFDLLTAAFLNNDGDSVILRDPEFNVVERIDYDKNNTPKKGESLARDVDGAGNFVRTTAPTPGEANIIVPPIVVGTGGSPTNIENNTVVDDVVFDCQNIELFINELYPNPPGSDLLDEFIEIINLSSSTINLVGWSLADLAQSFKLSGQIEPGEILFWKRPETKIALNNTTKETVKLIDPNKCEIDVVIYDKAEEGVSLARNDAGEYVWTNQPTPGEVNVFSQKDSGIVWKIRHPAHAVVGEEVVFDAEDSADTRGGEINFDWDFGGLATSSGAVASYVFSHPGEHQIIVFASSTSGSKGMRIITLNISAVITDEIGDVVITEILANPVGVDDKEFVEIYNSGSNEIDLSEWIIRANVGNSFVLPVGTKIKSGQYLAFFKTATKISINNTEDKISLINNENQLVDMVRIGKSKAGESYALINGEWKWSQPTPGSQNVNNFIVVSAQKISTKKITTYPLVAIEIARLMDKDDGVKTRGVVTVLPQMFGKQYFYIFDGKNGMQIYQYQGDFPQLKFGDLVEVKGILSEASGAKRVKLKNATAVDILAIEKNILPLNVEISQISEDYLGALIKVEGEITSKKSNFIYIDDGQGEIKIYFKQNAKIDKSNLNVGESISVVGVLEITSGDLAILPRQNSDLIVVDKNLVGTISQEEAVEQKTAKEVAEKYLTATAGGLTALFLGFLSRARGSAFIGLVKRIATKIITRV